MFYFSSKSMFLKPNRKLVFLSIFLDHLLLRLLVLLNETRTHCGAIQLKCRRKCNALLFITTIS